MGKNNKKGPIANVFKVAGAKSLKKTKAKAVNLGLKNLKQKVVDLDKQFLNDKKNPATNNNAKPKVAPIEKKIEQKVTKEDVANTTVKIDKMDIL
ncbi:unnamed protein product [Diatraea saccharalis]|uniref:Uncharacterized protein n=1 Tax=Diatraea saccharalis TaxID=40085 RepID=A0A9N9R420_9NEOP|nr:unnamed protein product [Diatraea saccharalis]